MRHDVHAEIVEKTDKWLERYFFTGQPRHTGLPSAESCARVQNMSSAYFDDLLKFETGKRTDEYVQFKRISVACDLLRRTDRSVAEIAEDLGCPSVRHFTSLFKKLKGCTPSLYKTPNWQKDSLDVAKNLQLKNYKKECNENTVFNVSSI